jgi:PAS domain S-box-containing protein
VENANDIIYRINTRGRFVYANIVALTTVGHSSDKLIGTSCLKLIHKDYRKLIVKMYEKQMLEKTNVTYYEFPIIDKNGKEMWLGHNAQIIIEKDKVVGLQAIARDISQKRKSDKSLRLKKQFEDIITHIATKFINLPIERMDEGINLTLQNTGMFTSVDRSYVFMYQDDGNFASNTYEWCNKGIIPQIDNLQFVSMDLLPWWKKQIDAQKVVHIPRVADMTEEQEAEKELLEAQDIKSLVVVPLVSNDVSIGFLGFDSVRNEKNWEEDFIDLLKIVAEVIVNLIQRMEAENKIKSLYSAMLDDIETASTIQSYLVPKWLILEDNIGFSSTYSPSLSVGGDIFDIIRISEEQYFVYIGDISGHGVQAALLMTAVKSIIKMITENEKGNTSPSWIVNRLNKVLCKELFDENYMTLFFAHINLKTNKMTFYNAGHPALIRYDCLTNQTQLIDSKGNVPIGWQKDIEYTKQEEGKVPINQNNVYLFYTDGIFECENKKTGKQLGIKGLQNFLEIDMEIENYLAFPQKVKQTLIDNDYDITTDDFTVLVFQRLFNSICYDRVDRKKGTCGRIRGICPLENDTTDDKCHHCDEQQFTITSLLQNIQAIGTACENVVINYTDNTTLAAKVELVVSEYLSNIIVHGLANSRGTKTDNHNIILISPELPTIFF